MRIAVQLHGARTEWEPGADLCEVLRDAGADVVAVPVYRWTPPDDPTAMDRLIEQIADHSIDAVSFTSAPAVASLLLRSKATGMLEAMLRALRTGVTAVCVGPVTAAPLVELEVPVSAPGRARLGSLARHLAEELPRRAHRIEAGGHVLSVRGRCVVVDGEIRCLAPAAMALMRTLAARPGRVVSREELLAALPGGRRRHPCRGNGGGAAAVRARRPPRSCRPSSSAATGSRWTPPAAPTRTTPSAAPTRTTRSARGIVPGRPVPDQEL